MSKTKPLSKNCFSKSLRAVHFFFLDSSACIWDEEKNNSKDHVIKFNLSQRSDSADSLGQRHFQTFAFSTPPSVYSLLVSVTETGKWEKKNEQKKKPKQHFLTGTHNSCQRDSAVKTKCSIVSKRGGRKRKTSFVFCTWLGYEMRYGTEAVTELGWLKAWENNISWEVFTDSRNNWAKLNIKCIMEGNFTKLVFLHANLHHQLWQNLLFWNRSSLSRHTWWITQHFHQFRDLLEPDRPEKSLLLIRFILQVRRSYVARKLKDVRYAFKDVNTSSNRGWGAVAMVYITHESVTDTDFRSCECNWTRNF